ncbi:MAG: hypothetical protein KF862_27735 [Chitinophagaceae bacterium]|nr:hypothetical protein [Chitinophagaceae bacterium]
MSLQNIKLPFTVLAGLYTAPLIQLKEQAGNDTTSSVKFLGSNQKQITILVNTADAPFLPDKSFNFLTGILSACRLTVADVAILNLSQLPGRQYQQIQQITTPAVMLLLGLEPSDIHLPFQFPHFQVQQYANVTYLAAPALELIEEDKAIKAKLWGSLKSLFQL